MVLGLLFSGNAYTSEWAVTIENNEFENKKSIYLASDDALPNKKLIKNNFRKDSSSEAIN